MTDSSGGNPRLPHMAGIAADLRPETGPARELPPQFRRALVDYRTTEPSGTIIIDTANTCIPRTHCWNGKAPRYGIGVARQASPGPAPKKHQGWQSGPTGTRPKRSFIASPICHVSWPAARDPLGARALYLGKTRLSHPRHQWQPSTIGTFVSSGCIRLTNEDVMSLYTRVKVDTRVVVLSGGNSPTTAAPLWVRAVGVRPPADVPSTR